MLANLRSVVDLRAGEARQVLRVGLALFAILGAHTLLETARDALFLQSLPVRDLAVVYGVMAAMALVTAPISAYLVRRLGRRHALVASLAASALGTLVLYALPISRSMVLALYLWTGLIASMVVVQLWLVVGQLFTMTQGKRVLGLVAAAGALGAVVAAATASLLLAWLPVQHLLPLGAALFVVAARAVRATRAIDGDATEVEHAGASRAFVTVRHQSYLRRLALLVAVSTAALLATDYLFKVSAVRALDAAALPVFFARFSAVVSSLSLVVQLVGVGCLVRRSGVLATLTVLPLVLLLGAGGALVFGGAFAAVVIAKAADGVLRHSLHRVSMELVWMPIPEEVREQVKEPVDGALVRIAQAATAAGLFGLAAAGFDAPVILAAVVAGLALLWLVAAALLRAPYLDQFRQALARPTFAATTDQELDLNAVEVVVEAMSSSDPRQVRAAIALLASHGRTRLVSSLVLLHDDPDVLCDALDVVAVPERRDWVPQARRLLVHPSAAVRAAALRALARAGVLDIGACAAPGIDPSLRGHVVFWRAHQGAQTAATDPATDEEVRAILAAPGADGHAARCALLDAIGEDGDPRWAGVVLALVESAADLDDVAGVTPSRAGFAVERNHAADELVAHAVPAIERSADPRFIPFLIDRLSVRRGRADVLVVLAKLGEPALAALEAAFVDPTTPVRLRVHLPQAIAAFGSQRAADFLTAQIGVHGATGFRVLRALARLAVRHGTRIERRAARVELERNLREHVRLLGVDAALARGHHGGDELLPILRGLLVDKREQAVERAFLLLQALHPDEDLRDVHQALTSGSRTERAHAHELLDAITRSYDDHLRDLVLLLADDLPLHQRLARGHALLATTLPDRRDALTHLLGDDDPAVVALATHHGRALARPAAAIDVPSAVATIALSPLPAPTSPRFARGTGTHAPLDMSALQAATASPTSAALPGPSLPSTSPAMTQGWAALSVEAGDLGDLDAENTGESPRAA